MAFQDGGTSLALPEDLVAVGSVMTSYEASSHGLDGGGFTICGTQTGRKEQFAGKNGRNAKNAAELGEAEPFLRAVV